MSHLQFLPKFLTGRARLKPKPSRQVNGLVPFKVTFRKDEFTSKNVNVGLGLSTTWRKRGRWYERLCSGCLLMSSYRPCQLEGHMLTACPMGVPAPTPSSLLEYFFHSLLILSKKSLVRHVISVIIFV